MLYPCIPAPPQNSLSLTALVSSRRVLPASAAVRARQRRNCSGAEHCAGDYSYVFPALHRTQTAHMRKWPWRFHHTRLVSMKKSSSSSVCACSLSSRYSSSGRLRSSRHSGWVTSARSPSSCWRCRCAIQAQCCRGGVAVWCVSARVPVSFVVSDRSWFARVRGSRTTTRREVCRLWN